MPQNQIDHGSGPNARPQASPLEANAGLTNVPAFGRAAALRRTIGPSFEGSRVHLVVVKGYETEIRLDGVRYSALQYVNLDEPPATATEADAQTPYLRLKQSSGQALLWVSQDTLMPLLATPDPSVIVATLSDYTRQDRPGHTHNFTLTDVTELHYPFDEALTAKIAANRGVLDVSRVPGASTVGFPPVNPT